MKSIGFDLRVNWYFLKRIGIVMCPKLHPTSAFEYCLNFKLWKSHCKLVYRIYRIWSIAFLQSLNKIRNSIFTTWCLWCLWCQFTAFTFYLDACCIRQFVKWIVCTTDYANYLHNMSHLNYIWFLNISNEQIWCLDVKSYCRMQYDVWVINWDRSKLLCVCKYFHMLHEIFQYFFQKYVFFSVNLLCQRWEIATFWGIRNLFEHIMNI